MLKISGHLAMTGSILCTLQAATGPPAAALDRWIEFTNNTRMVIAEIYISRVGAQLWDVDLLGTDLLAPASSVLVNIDDEAGCRIRPQNRLRRWHHPDPSKRECMRRGEICDLLSIARGSGAAMRTSRCFDQAGAPERVSRATRPWPATCSTIATFRLLIRVGGPAALEKLHLSDRGVSRPCALGLVSAGRQASRASHHRAWAHPGMASEGGHLKKGARPFYRLASSGSGP